MVAWVESRIPAGVSLMALSAVVGTLAGIGAWALKVSIGTMFRFFTRLAAWTGTPWILLILPIVGILITQAYQKYIVKHNLEHGTARLQQMLDNHQYALRRGLTIQPLIASIITLGMGGSAGAEGPIATSGAAIGSNLGRICRVSPDMMRILIGCGAGAGIAGIFKAPIGGVLFALEVMKVQFTTLTVIALIVACICGAMSCYILTGFTFDVRFLPTSFFDPTGFWWLILFGIFCGLYSIYYNVVTDMLHRWFKSFKSVWFKNISGGIIVGVCLMLFPSMYGEGYGEVTHLVNGEPYSFASGGLLTDVEPSALMFILLAGACLLLKVFATIASNSAGGVAGDFAPTIFAGAFAGLVFAWCMNYFFDAHLPVALFCLFGTAGAFSGIIHAPLMAIFLVAEMVGNGYGFFLPLTITSVISYLTVKLLAPTSKYRTTNHDDIDALVTAKYSAPNK